MIVTKMLLNAKFKTKVESVPFSCETILIQNHIQFYHIVIAIDASRVVPILSNLQAVL